MTSINIESGTTSPASSPTETTPPSPAAGWWSRFGTLVLQRLVLVGGLFVLVMLGLLLTNLDHPFARFYWSAMFPIFGVVSIWHELTGPPPYTGPLWRLLLIQALHWLGPIVAVRIVFLQLVRGQMAADEVALMTLLVLALTCFMAGVHMDRNFFWISALLALAAVFGTEIEAYLWMLVMIAAIAVVITALAGIALRRTTQVARATS